jgi:hypothetical protein
MAGLTTVVWLPIGCGYQEGPCNRLSYWYVKHSEWYSCQREKLAALLQQELRCRTVANADLELRCSGMRHCTIPLHLTSGSGFSTGIDNVWGLIATPQRSFIGWCLCTGANFMTLYSYKRSNNTGDDVCNWWMVFCERLHNRSADQDIICFNGIKVHYRGFESSPIGSINEPAQSSYCPRHVFRRDTI